MLQARNRMASGLRGGKCSELCSVVAIIRFYALENFENNADPRIGVEKDLLSIWDLTDIAGKGDGRCGG